MIHYIPHTNTFTDIEQRMSFLIRLNHDRNAAILTSSILLSKDIEEPERNKKIKRQENSESQRSYKTVEETH